MFQFVVRLPQTGVDPLAVAIAANVQTARQACCLTLSQLADQMRIPVQQLDRQLRPEQYPNQHLSLFRLARVEWRFWAHLTPLLIGTITKNMCGVFVAEEQAS